METPTGPRPAYVAQPADLGAFATQRARFRDGRVFTGADGARAAARERRLAEKTRPFFGANTAKAAVRAAKLADKPGGGFVVLAADGKRHEERLRRLADNHQ